MLDVIVYSEVKLYREGIALILAGEPGLHVSGTPDSPLRAMGLVQDGSVGVALLDTMSVDCAVLARELHRCRPSLGLVALSLAGDEEGMLQWAQAGFLGFVPRNGSARDLLDTVHSVARGELVCSPRVAARIAQRLASIDAARPGNTACDVISRRELEVLTLVEQGLGNKQVAQQLHISVATVKNHVHAILAKLEVGSREEAAQKLRESWRVTSGLTSA